MNKAEIIIPTWNSMPEFKETIKSIPDAFKNLKTEVFVVDKSSTDGTREYAEDHGCHVLIDNHSLGSARLTGVKAVESDSLFFIDSDIVLPEHWFSLFNQFRKNLSKEHNDIGMIFGKTLDVTSRILEMQKKRLPIFPRLLKKGERAWTNNTWIMKEFVETAKIKEVNAWEDWVIAQNVMNHGYKVFEVPIAVEHIHESMKKWGFTKAGWNAKGMLKVVGLNLYSFKYLNYYLIEGIRSSIEFRNLFYMKWGIVSWKEVWEGVLNVRNFSRK